MLRPMQINNGRGIMNKHDYGKEWNKIMAEGLKQSVILLNGLSRTIVADDNIKTVYDVLDMINMQQDAMKAQIVKYGGRYE